MVTGLDTVSKDETRNISAWYYDGKTKQPYERFMCHVCGAPETADQRDGCIFSWHKIVFTAALRFEPDRCQFCAIIETGLLLHYRQDTLPPVVSLHCYPGLSFRVYSPTGDVLHSITSDDFDFKDTRTLELHQKRMKIALAKYPFDNRNGRSFSELFRLGYFGEMPLEFYTLPSKYIFTAPH
jgi:hypothetical protein